MDSYARYSPPKKRRLPQLVLILLLLGAGGYMMTQSLRQGPVISPIPEDKPAQISLPRLFAKKKTPEELGRRIEKEIHDTWKNYSIYVKDYNSDFAMGINEAVIYTAASVNKIPILASLYYLAEKGEVNLDQIITLQSSDIQDYGTGIIRYDPPGSTYSVKTLARLMMQKSDNTAAYLLANYVIGLDKVQQIIESWGLVQTDMVNNKTSNKDMALLFEKIVTGKVANQANTAEMLSFLKGSDFEDRLPADLPSTATVYHKIGTEVRTIHDVGIVTDGKLSYYVGIFTTDVPDEEEATKLIAQISKIVYDFMR